MSQEAIQPFFKLRVRSVGETLSPSDTLRTETVFRYTPNQWVSTRKPYGGYYQELRIGTYDSLMRGRFC